MRHSQLCDRLKGLDLGGYLSCWVVHRDFDDTRQAVYKALRVEVDERLEEKLRGLVRNTVDSIDEILKFNYDTTSYGDSKFVLRKPQSDDEEDEDVVEQTNRAYLLNDKEARFEPLRTLVDKGLDAPLAKSEKELVKSFALIVKIEVRGGGALYAFRKVSRTWTTKKVGGGLHTMNTYFLGGVLIDLDDKPVFQIDRKIDFLAWKDDLFILDVEAFEAGLNFRETLELQRDRLVGEFDELKLFTNPEAFTAAIKNRLPLLRIVDSIRRNGYYKKPEYVESMIAQAEENGWPLEVVDGMIVVKEELVPIILKLLNNDRLRSPINLEFFDVWGKERVSAAETAEALGAMTPPMLTVAPTTRMGAKKAPQNASRRRRARAS